MRRCSSQCVPSGMLSAMHLLVVPLLPAASALALAPEARTRRSHSAVAIDACLRRQISSGARVGDFRHDLGLSGAHRKQVADATAVRAAIVATKAQLHSSRTVLPAPPPHPVDGDAASAAPDVPNWAFCCANTGSMKIGTAIPEVVVVLVVHSPGRPTSADSFPLHLLCRHHRLCQAPTCVHQSINISCGNAI